MKKISLGFVGLFFSIFSLKAQKTDTTYKNKRLSIEEANLVSSYYHQEGDHAAVTGGTGTQKLTDIANIFDVKLLKYDKQNNKHHLDLEVGLDYYTSASSDKIDLSANSSASHADLRVYPSISYTVDNAKHNFTLGGNASLSNEFDYLSKGFGVEFAKRFNNNNSEVGIKAKAYLDDLKLIYPVELRTWGGGGHDDDHYATAKRNSYSASLNFSQVVNERLQLMLIADFVKQDGYLGLPFHRVYFTDGSVNKENLPNSRTKVPMGIRANYFLGDKVVLRSFYRYYQDNWGVNSHTADLELAYKINPFFSLSPFYRFYNQTASDYFQPYKLHKTTDTYFTSNYDQSKFNSQFFGAGLRLSTPGGVLGIKHFNMLELRFGHYLRSDGLNSNILSLNIKAK